MSHKPIFVATHPRACSTAFERVFMTQHETLQCLHEPFSDAFYFGPEKLGVRYATDEKACVESGLSASSYRSVMDRIEKEGKQGKRILIKDMAYYLSPVDGNPASIAQSLVRHEAVDNTTELDNPTVVPTDLLNTFHFAFLIRHPSKSIPSFWRCTVPPLSKTTGWDTFLPNEAGYHELRKLFDYLQSVGQIGPDVAGKQHGSDSTLRKCEICVIDADDLLDWPAETIEKFCRSVGLKYSPDMLVWSDDSNHEKATKQFEKWNGWHNDALESNALIPRAQKHDEPTIDGEYDGWVRKYGEAAAKVIKETAEANLDDYNYLKQFALQVGQSSA